MANLIRTPGGSPARRWLLGLALLGLVVLAVLQRSGRVPRARAAPPVPPARAVPVTRPEPPREDWPAGPLRRPDLLLGFALVHVDPATASGAPALVRQLARARLPGFRLEQGEGVPDRGGLRVSTGSERFTARELQYRSHGLDESARAALVEGRPSTSLVLRTPAGDRQALRGLVGLLAEAAGQLGAAVQDWEARQVWSAAAFADNAREGFQGDLPVAPRHLVIDAYDRGDGLLRSVTLGMNKLGLPDVVVNGHRAGDTRPVGNLIQLVCQWLVEHREVPRAGAIDLELAAVRADLVRRPNQEHLEPGARPRVTITVARAQPEEGDATNELMELTFGGVEGAPLERQGAVLAAVFGSTERLSYLRHDEELLAASALARARLLQLKPRWEQGRVVGEVLLVKAPFRTPRGGNEWMWVEVTAWKGKAISGVLANTPFHVPGLRQGAQVTVEEEAVFDYLLRKPDGSTEGNETEPMVRAREAR